MKKFSISKQLGLTLLELVFTMVIVAVLASLAVPSYDRLIKEGRKSSELKNFLGSLFMARSEAVKRGLRAVVCTSTNGASCDNSANWDSGWIVFIDTNSNDTLDSGEQVIHVGAALDNGSSLIGTTNVATMIRYQSNGDSLESGSFTFCDSRGASEAEAILLTASGRPKISETGACGGTLSCP